VELQETEIGLMPADWELRYLGDEFATQLGKMLSPKSSTGNDLLPYLRNANVQWGKILFADLLRMNFSETERSKYSVKIGDLMVCEGGVIGRSALVRNLPQDLYFQKAIHRVRPKSQNTSNEYLYYHMCRAFEYEKIYGDLSAKTTIAHLPKRQLESLKLPFPNKKVQNEIVSRLDVIAARLETVEGMYEQSNSVLVSMLRDLLTGRIRIPVLASTLQEVRA